MPTTPTTGANQSNTDTAATAVDEAMRITAETSRRTADNARAAVEAARSYFDQSVALNRQVVALGLTTTRAGMQVAFDLQNAAFATTLNLIDSSAKLNTDTVKRYADIARLAQHTTTDAYQATANLVESLVSEPRK